MAKVFVNKCKTNCLPDDQLKKIYRNSELYMDVVLKNKFFDFKDFHTPVKEFDPEDLWKYFTEDGFVT
jgi:hypothetical protein